MALGAALGLVLVARDAFFSSWAWYKVRSILVSFNRHGSIIYLLSFCVVGVTLWHWVARLGWFCWPAMQA